MSFMSLASLSLLACSIGSVLAAPTYDSISAPVRRQETANGRVRAEPLFSRSSSANSSCINSATTRSCWGDGFDINTDASKSWPATGKVVPVSSSILR